MISRRKSPDGLPFRLYERRGRRYVSYWYVYKNGQREVLSRARSVDAQGIKKAMREAVRKATLINTGDCLRETVAVLIDRYFDWQDAMPISAEMRKAQSTLNENKRESKNLKRFFGEMMPDAVKARHCYGYQDLRIRESAGAKANKELSLLSAVFEYGRRVGVVDENPCRGIQRVPVRPRDFLADETDMEYALYVARKVGGIYPIIALCAKAAYLMVKRPCEILSLRFDQLTEDGILFNSAKRKAGQAQIKGLIVWSDELRKVINEANQIKRHHDRLGLYVFGNLAGEVYTRSGWGTNWGRLMKRCEEYAKKEGKQFIRFTLNDCRPAGVTGKKSKGDHDTQDATLHRDGRMIERVYDRRRLRVATPVK